MGRAIGSSARRPAPLAAAALAAGVIAIAAVAGHSSAAPQLHALAHGALSQSNSHDGEAILSVDNLAPGGSATGTVTIGNTGTLSGALALSGSVPSNVPGRNGGILSRVLELEITDVTSGSDITVFDGGLEAMSFLALVDLIPGDQRTYRFTARMPDGGVPGSGSTGDNRFQLASTSVDYQWTLSAVPPRRCGNELRGDARANRIVGTAAGDRILGGGGRDRLRARRGRDCVAGGPGRDRLYGGRGRDRVRTGRGRDRALGGRGRDVLSARGGGRDVVNCGPGDDRAIVDRRDRVRSCER